ncbi:MAG: lysylphosphatidylglycerol synthase domain-containing protein, partial [Thermoanaerobaculia bacterium]
MRSYGRLGLTLAAGCVVSAAFAWLVLGRMDLQVLAAGLGRADGRVLLLAFGCQLLGLACLGWRARILLAPLSSLTFSLATRGQLLGLTVNNVLPFRVGELAKADYFARHASLPRSSTVAAAAVERVLDLLCLAGVLAMVAPIALPRFEHVSALS